MADELPYQQAGQIRQLLAERENAVAYEQTDRIAAIDKQLSGLGYKPKQAAKAADAAAVSSAAASAEAEVLAKGEPPKGRTASSPRRQTTAQG
jgi:hypothetical protein